MMIKNKILFSGILFLLFATGLQAAKPESVPELKTADEYFGSGENKIPEDKNTEELKKLISGYSSLKNRDDQIKFLREIAKKAFELRGEKSFSDKTKQEVLKDIQYKANSILEGLKTPEERLFHVISSVGGVKEEDLEKAKKSLKDSKTTKKVDLPQKTSYKYTQSIAHLLVVFDSNKEKNIKEYFKSIKKKMT